MIVLLISSPLILNVQMLSTKRAFPINRQSPIFRNQLAFTSHDPIIITSDSDFSALGFPGIGSQEDPYVIKDYNISTGMDCISISDTDVHFLIQNCLLTGGDEGSGIYMYNVINGEINNNTITQKDHSLRLRFSSNIAITNNTIIDNYKISLYASMSNELLNNNITGNSGGVSLDESSNNTITNNTISGNNGLGVHLYNSPDATLTNNSILGNTGGIYLYNSSETILTNNTITANNAHGISLRDSPDCILSANNMGNNGIALRGSRVVDWRQNITKDNAVNGKPIGYYWNLIGETIDENPYSHLILANCTAVTIENIVFNNTCGGLTLGHSSYCTLKNSTILGNSIYGLQLSYSSYNTIANNTILDMDVGRALCLSHSSHNELSNNTITGSLSNIDGVLLSVSSYNTLVNNTITGFQYSVNLFYSSNNNRLVSNTISGTWVCGVYIAYSSNNIVSGNYITSNSGLHGVHLHEATSNELVNNTISPGVYLFDSSYNELVNNTISGGGVGVSLILSWSNELVSNYITNNSGYGVYCDSRTYDNLLYLNVFTSNGGSDALDDGSGNKWNITGIGNNWSDYSGVGLYSINGAAGAFDYHPIHDLETTPPTIDNPDDVEYSEGTLNHIITWTPIDDHPSRYIVYQNGTEVQAGSWVGQSITINIEGLTVGVYNYTIVVYDFSENWVSNNVFVTVIAMVPTPTASTTPTTSLEDETNPLGLVMILLAEIGFVIVFIILLLNRKHG